MSESEFQAKWEAKRNEFEQLGAQVNGAVLCREILSDWELVRTARDECLLSLAEAAAYSGYSSDHLRRLVREGKLVPAARRGRRLFFRAADLPKKPVVVDAALRTLYDASAHARQVANRRSHGGSTP
jgi:hypothetical protein